MERAGERPHHRADVVLGVERVGEGRFHRLVMRRERAVFGAPGREEPAAAVGFHDERLGAADRVHSHRARAGAVAGGFGRLEVRLVKSRPPLLVFIPIDVLLAL